MLKLQEDQDFKIKMIPLCSINDESLTFLSAATLNLLEAIGSTKIPGMNIILCTINP